MLYTPTNKRVAQRSNKGVVGSTGASGPWMRRLSFPVQTNTKPAINWRATFLTTKQNWAALGRGGSGYIPVNGIDPQALWATLAATYFGIFEAGLIVNGVQLMGRLIGCATPDAFYTMCQANRASLGLTPLPIPAMVSEYLAFPGSPYTHTFGGWSVSAAGLTAPSPTNPSISLVIAWDATGHPDAPFNLIAAGDTLAVDVSPVTLDYETNTVLDPQAATATATSSTITFTIPSWSNFENVNGDLLTTTGFSPAGYNVSGATIIGNTSNSVTVATASNPGAMTTGGMAGIFAVLVNNYTATLNVSPTPATVNGSIALQFSFTDSVDTYTGVINLAATSGTLVIDNPCPSFDYPTGMSCSTLYDSGYNVTGFLLTYNAINMASYPMMRDGVEIPGVWEVLASDAYTNSYAPPAANTWHPILFIGPYLPNPSDVLTAWVAVYGPLPDTGSIKFQLLYIDPETGSSGPALSATAGWEKGTLKGFNRASWTGPLFGWSAAPVNTAISAPGSNTQTISLYGVNGYGGVITMTPKSNSIVETGANATNKAFPAGFTITVSPASVTIPPGSATPVTATIVMTAASGAQQFAGPIKIAAADGLSTISAAFELTLSGDVVAQPPPDYLTISPGQANPHPPSPGSATVVFTIENTGPDDIDVTMLADCDNAAIGLFFTPEVPTNNPNYGNASFTIPAGSYATPGTKTMDLIITVPANTDTDGIRIQVNASAGVYTAAAAVVLSL
jgi:hypothetical protein